MISVLEATNELHAVGQDGSILGVAIDELNASSTFITEEAVVAFLRLLVVL